MISSVFPDRGNILTISWSGEKKVTAEGSVVSVNIRSTRRLLLVALKVGVLSKLKYICTSSFEISRRTTLVSCDAPASIRKMLMSRIMVSIKGLMYYHIAIWMPTINSNRGGALELLSRPCRIDSFYVCRKFDTRAVSMTAIKSCNEMSENDLYCVTASKDFCLQLFCITCLIFTIAYW